jgi:hypothetical protein
MPRHLLTLALVCAIAACAAHANPSAGAAPPPSGGPRPVAPAPAALHLTPGTSRFLVRQDLTIHTDFTGMPPTMTFGMGVYLTAAIAAPADSLGYPTTFTVDSMLVDSGSTLPPGVSPAVARGLRVSGHLTPSGEFTNSSVSDSSAAQRLGNLLPRFRNFYPRLPAAGVRPGDEWTDSAKTTETAAGTTVTTHSQSRRAAPTWEARNGIRALRIESTTTFNFEGSGEQQGAVFTLGGSGIAGGVQYLTAEGQYLGGEAHDSTTLSIELTQQGMTIPRRQLAHTTITLLPR